MTNSKKSLVSGLALGAALLLPTIALAQPATGFGEPTPPPTPAPAPAPAPAPVAAPAPAPAPAPVYAPAPTAPAPAPAPMAAPAAPVVPDAPPTARAAGLSLGLGINYLLGGAELDRPDGASARFRLASALTFEPFVRLATSGQSRLDGDEKDAQNELLLGTNVRLPLKSRGKVDLIATVGGSLGFNTNDPDGDDNNSTTTSLGIDYGLGVEYWYNANWCLSFTARNPFVNYQSTSFEISGDATTSNIDVGAIWTPLTELSLHLFY